MASISAVALGRPATIPLGLALTVGTTSAVVGAALAFSLFGKHRRDGEPPAPDDVLSGHAARGMTSLVADLATAPISRPSGSPAPGSPLEGELAMPRWRRPSLLEARMADPVRDSVIVPRLTFDHGLVGPLDGHERRLIGYSVVRLLDRPDELRASEIGFVDQGDEVQLLEKSGVYWLVLCPDGREGWVHQMTLGEKVGGPVEAPATAMMPIAADLDDG
ncbi:MAG: SH3 domain-containing protein [Chloroflexi bacterium]|nr:SH3 domain-containing protein [Chloroflexota bacterium]